MAGEQSIALINPTAVEDPPSMHMLARGLDKVREDVARVSSAVDDIRALLSAGGAHQRLDVESMATPRSTS